MFAGAIIAAAVTAAAPFAPPLDRAIGVVAQETRSGDSKFEASVKRTIIFRRTDGGFLADVTTERPARPERDPLAAAAAAAMAGRTVRFTLDALGVVTGVEGCEALWSQMLDSIAAAMRAKDPERAAAIATVLAPLRAAPPARQLAILSGAVIGIVGRDVSADGAVAAHGVTVAARSPDGSIVTLAGDESTTHEPDGSLIRRRDVRGTFAGGVMRQASTRRVDSATGLVRESRQTSEISASGATATVTRTMVVTF